MFIESLTSEFQTCLDFLVIDKITEKIPQHHFDISTLKLPENIALSNPDYSKPGNIDILLGAGVFFDLISCGQYKLHERGPILQNSKLGYIISGPLQYYPSNSITCNLVQTELQSQIEKFWLLEETDKKHIKFTKEELEVEEHFINNFNRDSTGRFIVRLPVRDTSSLLGDNLDGAIKRFYSLERKFLRDPKLCSDYSKFMQEYADMGHMSAVDHGTENQGIIHYLPHHAVKKETSLTTKLRVVFDAASKSQSNLSLNDVLKVGPCIQDDIFSILIRFRSHDIVFTADIAKMYRQILIDEKDRNLQRIVWRANPSHELTHYKLNTVTYGTSPASFLATRCLKQLALENVDNHPTASYSIEHDFYMDDWLGGAPDVDSALKLIQEVTQILKNAGLILRQWISNSTEILENLASQSSDLQYNIKDNQNSNKTLGVLWDASHDYFRYSVAHLRAPDSFTKRSILSTIAQIFDPLGLLGPVVLTSKLILQNLWQIKADWDSPVTSAVLVKWSHFYDNLHCLNSLSIPRHIMLKNACIIELHTFSDASQSAYGSCIYARSVNESGEINVNLICSKSRVAPLKTVSVPRLELCGALLAAQLYKRVTSSLNLKLKESYFWCDSRVTLSWISADPSRFKTFVSNRIAQIQSLTQPTQWRYVPTACNPADLVSRGTYPHEIEKLSYWFHGPSFLYQNSEFWPPSISLQEVETPETKLSCVSVKVDSVDDIISRFSSFNKLVHVTAYLLRFIHNTRVSPPHRRIGDLTNEEIENSIVILVKIVQGEEFLPEIKALEKSHRLSKNSKLLNLNPFVDQLGVLRVGGRISKSQLKFNAKHPMIIPSKHHFTTLIVRREHIKNLHAGCQTVLASVRASFWPLNGKQAVKRVLRNCVTCFRVKPRFLNSVMGQLPASRVTPSRPFSVCGTDFSGPYLIKDSKFRNRKLIKAYICLFICFASKAVHLELVSDLTTEGFLNAFKRFVSRRGVPNDIYSDNATNYVGADKHLNKFIELVKDPQFKGYLSDLKITWHFIPARSPHFGGLWESAVRSAKYHMKRIMSNVKLTFEEFYTCLSQIECILNSRPIYPLTEDPEDIEPLTPGHFLIGTALNALPEANVLDTRSTHVSRYKHLQFMIQQFWLKWSKNYLHSLQQRTKWHYSKVPDNLKGSLVILHEDNLPPTLWKLGRVIETHPGTDGFVRVVSVKTPKGVVRRSVVKISVLPLENTDQ